MKVWVVFSDSFNRILRDEDCVCYSAETARKHMRDLRKDGHEPVQKVFESEEAFYVWKDRG